MLVTFDPVAPELQKTKVQKTIGMKVTEARFTVAPKLKSSVLKDGTGVGCTVGKVVGIGVGMGVGLTEGGKEIVGFELGIGVGAVDGSGEGINVNVGN
jgi:hypothetical protein